ncbi:acyl-CoA dehydrogenase family protein [Cryptosporangium aurantiacum]|uniref:Acyl-CoA dehydrogenase n=1 Tax=Cryptosporangium aurantiacum TaxID=134849 RepID=A0A1M7RK93_9ACTN|nr:acyl-CoA dehydrogenase family protein [Cryptosporangium aurantiacum]SHN46566.1 Acyl-CoA dehydrogenase [Cryptosporangium aurantiacum]
MAEVAFGGGDAFGLGADAAAFGERVRAFLDRELTGAAGYADPADLTGLAEEFERELSRRAGAEGLLGSAVDAAHGGPGRGAAHQAAFDYVAAACDAPLVDTALTLAGHPLLHDANAEQQAYFLPRMLRGEILMCIAYTEPDAGTDLRAITTTAAGDGDGYRLTGVKTLVTGAHKADWCVTIARTPEPDRPGALTMFLVDLAAPGVTVRRRPTMNGWTLDEIEFDDVRLGADAVLGQPGQAWRQLVAAVRSERSGLFYLGFARHVLDLLVTYVRATRRGGQLLADDPLVRDAIAGLEIDVEAGSVLAARAVAAPGSALASMAKVFGTELLQRLAQTATEIAGHAGTVWAPPHSSAPPHGAASPHGAAGGRFAWEYLERVHGTIGAGANEVLRDGIADFGLGLPRQAR